MTPKELRAKKAKLVNDAREKLASITDKMSAEERGAVNDQVDAMILEAEGFEAEAQRAERLGTLEAGLEERSHRRPEMPGGEARTDTPEAVTYRAAYHAVLRAGGDVHAITAEERAALARGVRQFDAEHRAQVAGTDAAGGFLIPDEQMAGLVKSMAAWGPMYTDGFCRVLNTTGGATLPIPGVDDTAGRAGASTEGAPLTNDGGQDVTFTRSTLGDFMFDTEWVKLSLQFITGSMENAEAVINDLLGERLGRTANEKLTVGTGTGEPLGIVTGATAGPNAAAAAALAADDILALYHSVDPAYRASPMFRAQFNDNTLLAVHRLKDGDGNFLVRQAPDGAGRLAIGAVTVPYAINQAMADIGANARSMIMGDHSRYFVRKIGGPVLGTSRDSVFWPNLGIAGYARFDGALADAKAIKALVHPAS